MAAEDKEASWVLWQLTASAAGGFATGRCQGDGQAWAEALANVSQHSLRPTLGSMDGRGYLLAVEKPKSRVGRK